MRAVPALVLLLLACAKPPDRPLDPVATTAAPAPRSLALSVGDAIGGASATSEETDLYFFEHSYPAAAGRIPALRAMLERERDEARGELIDTAAAERKAMAAEGIEYRPHSYSAAWQTVAELPQWLSLSAVVGTFEGGAHPNHGFAALLWDKAAGVRREPLDLFDRPAFRAATQLAFCAELDRQRAEKRGEPIDRNSGDPFDQCLDPVEDAVVILGSSTGRTFDRIGLLVAPYGAGPYAEGDYEVTLPVDGALLAAVRPEFRAAFAVKR